MTNSKKTIVYFHTGRGGRFYNAGCRSFGGSKDIGEVLAMNDNRKNHSFLDKENFHEIYEKVEKLENLRKLLEDCRDNDDYTVFEKKTGLELGEDVYTDCNGNQIITVAEVELGVGTLNWDGYYDTDTCMLLSDCSEGDLKLIAESNEYDKDFLMTEYFDNNTDLAIDWKRFSGNYIDLIDGYFNDNSFDINEFYEEEENEEEENEA
jgi:hypothetical protein